MFTLALIVLNMVALWKLFEKAGEPGWKAVIPYYNSYIYCKIAHCTGLFIAELVLGVVSRLALWAVSFAGLFSFFRNHIEDPHDYFHMQGFYPQEFHAEAVPKFSFLFVAAAFLTVLVILAVIRIFINRKFIKYFTKETPIVVLACIGSFRPLWVLLVIARCIIGFDEKYLYIRAED